MKTNTYDDAPRLIDRYVRLYCRDNRAVLDADHLATRLSRRIEMPDADEGRQELVKLIMERASHHVAAIRW